MSLNEHAAAWERFTFSMYALVVIAYFFGIGLGFWGGYILWVLK